MSALASLAAYGDEDEDEVQQPSAPAAAQAPPSHHETDPPAASGTGSSGDTTNGHKSAASPVVAPTDPTRAPAASSSETISRSQSFPSPVLQPSRTPSSLTSSIAHMLPQLPPPVTATNAAIEAKIQSFFAALQRGHSVSEQLRSSKRFNNPDILEKLVSFYELDESGSNYDPRVFDPHAPFLRKEDYKSLADRQAEGHQPAPKGAVDFIPQQNPPQLERRAENEKAKDAADAATSKSKSDSKPAPAADKGGKRSKWDVTEDEVPAAKALKPAAPVVAKAAAGGSEMSAYRQFLEKRKNDGK